MQRAIDIVLSAVALTLLLPIFLLVGLVLRFSGEGEVFFAQRRVGRYGRPFNLYKFATMLKDSPNIGTGTVTLKDDPRVLPAGRFLRKTKINELPQLLNILLGDMSIVGPRPQTQRCFDAFPRELQDTIVQVRPGLSGLGPIVFRDEEEILADHGSSTSFYDEVIAPYKGRVEAWYVENQGVVTYFKIIAITGWVVLFPGSSVVWRAFPDIPVPPPELRTQLSFQT